MKTDFYFRLEKEVGMAIDNETGEKCEAYMCLSMKHNNPIAVDKTYLDLQQTHIKILSRQLNCDEKYITPISAEEYHLHTDEEDIVLDDGSEC